jgi:hypothetical protein
LKYIKIFIFNENLTELVWTNGQRNKAGYKSGTGKIQKYRKYSQNTEKIKEQIRGSRYKTDVPINQKQLDL